MAGGSTRIPAAQDKVRQLTGKEPSKSLHPDECVATGASILGGKLAGDAGAGEILRLDVIPLSLSNETKGGLAIRLIERNSTIPTSMRKETVVKMNCIKCGQPLAEGAKFCQNCGMRVEKRQIFCINCGARLESPSARFCPSCGVSIGQNQERQAVNSAKNDTTQSGVNQIKNNAATETGRLFASLDMVTMVAGGSKKASGPLFVYDDRIEFRKEKIYSAGSTIAAVLLTVVVVICLQYFLEVSLGGLWIGLIAGGLVAGMNYLHQGKQNPVDVYPFRQIINVSVSNNKFKTLVITVNSGVGNRKIGFNPDVAHKQEIQNIANFLQSCLHGK